MTRLTITGDAVEAEMIKGLLEANGIPTFLHASGARVDGFELAFGMTARGTTGGPQDVMVPADRVEEATEVLAAVALSEDEPGRADLAE
jgi:hypothetical protein